MLPLSGGFAASAYQQRNEYQPKGGDALRLGSIGRYGSCGWQVKLCDHLPITGHISAL